MAVSVVELVLGEDLCAGQTISGDDFQSGSGTAGDPYLICDANQLDNMRDDLDARYKLGTNIALSNWTPVGSPSAPFTGSLQGAGFAIATPYMNSSGSGAQYSGLFGVTGSSARIENLGILLSANITVYSTDERVYAGALAGENAGSISNCYSLGSKITLTSVTDAKPVYGGGLVGINTNSGTITSSYSIVEVSASAWGSGANSYAGGLAGENSGTISNSYAGGVVDSHSSHDGGGLVGANSGTITNSYVRGLVDESNGGGFATSNTGTITSSYYDTESTGMAAVSCVSGDCSGAVGLSMNQMGNTYGSYPALLGSGFELTQNFYPKIKRCTSCTGILSFSSDLVAGQDDVSTLYTGTWNAGAWGSCSGACDGGSGTETRTVTCEGGNGLRCDPATELDASQICVNDNPCCQGTIRLAAGGAAWSCAEEAELRLCSVMAALMDCLAAALNLQRARAANSSSCCQGSWTCTTGGAGLLMLGLNTDPQRLHGVSQYSALVEYILLWDLLLFRDLYWGRGVVVAVVAGALHLVVLLIHAVLTCSQTRNCPSGISCQSNPNCDRDLLLFWELIITATVGTVVARRRVRGAALSMRLRCLRYYWYNMQYEYCCSGTAPSVMGLPILLVAGDPCVTHSHSYSYGNMHRIWY